jgi:hypothetical protein
MTKQQVAVALIAHIAEHLQAKSEQNKSDGESIETNSAEKPT